MPQELNPAVARNLADGAMGLVPLTPGNKVLCTKRQLQECLAALAQEAYAMGFLAGQKERFGSLVAAGAAERPAWMDILLDDHDSLSKHGIRLRPVVVRSLAGAGCRVLGDLYWVSGYELRKLFYIGRKTARQIRLVSTTVLGIQRYTTTRLRYQGVPPAQAGGDTLLLEMLRAHYRAQQEDTMERFQSVGSAIPLRWTKNFPNGAGDLAEPPEFIIGDPDLEQLEKLFSVPDPRSESGLGDEEV